jgi:hypothetical protein
MPIAIFRARELTTTARGVGVRNTGQHVLSGSLEILANRANQSRVD